VRGKERRFVAIDVKRPESDGNRVVYNGPETQMPRELYEKCAIYEGRVTTDELAVIFGLTKRTVIRYCDEDGLPFEPLPRRGRVHTLSAVAKWFESRVGRYFPEGDNR
jgi:hypothetical protein